MWQPLLLCGSKDFIVYCHQSVYGEKWRLRSLRDTLCVMIWSNSYYHTVVNVWFVSRVWLGRTLICSTSHTGLWWSCAWGLVTWSVLLMHHKSSVVYYLSCCPYRSPFECPMAPPPHKMPVTRVCCLMLTPPCRVQTIWQSSMHRVISNGSPVREGLPGSSLL